VLGAIIGEDVLRQHLHLTDTADRLVVNVQQAVCDLQPCTTLYPVALTEADLNATAYATVIPWRNESPVTDLTIRYKDVLVLIEVKRTGEDCLAQLKGQVAAYQESEGDDRATVMSAKALSWARVVRLATTTRNLHQLAGHASPFTADFVQLIQYHRPHWDEVLPFASIPFARGGAVNEAALYKRLHYIQQQAFGDKLKWFNDRVAMPINVGWASEIITHPELSDDNQGCIVVNIWPGNTKGQGWPLFQRSLDWMHTKILTIDGQTYAVDVEKYLKFSHFNRYIFEAHVPSEFMSKPSFDTYAGKWERDSWPELETMLTKDIGHQWEKHKDSWHNHFINTDRNYTAVSLGFAVSVYVPYVELQQLDSSTENWQPVADKFNRIIRAMCELIDGATTA